MTLWVDRALALAIHDRQIAEHGGTAGELHEPRKIYRAQPAKPRAAAGTKRRTA